MFNSLISPAITLSSFIACMATAIVLGVLTSLVFSFRSRHSSSFMLALALLPAAVTMMVNGNVGAGLAVAGTFAIVRFRSAQGTAREIVGLFLSMSIGLVCGMGYIYVAMLYFAIMAAFVLLLTLVKFGERNSSSRILKITIPETLDYDGLFDDLFDKYTSYHELVRVKTTNMGTLYELSYLINLKSDSGTKAFMDDLRCRNGNLNIICGRETDKDSI